MLTRRSFIAVSSLALPQFLHAAPERFRSLPAAFARLERANGGRLGAAVLDTATGERAGYRADERFPMCSTFKFLLVSLVLRRVDRHEETLDRPIPVPQKSLVENSPLTEPHAGGAMTIAELCHAALTRSDNTAANLLLETAGGPAGVTGFARSIGDRVTRLDRNEPTVNESRKDDPRDTTSSRAMTEDLRNIFLKNVLTPASVGQLTKWMSEGPSGFDRLRANLPEGWRAADKTGSNGEHTSNDVAMFWPPNRPPVAVAVYITQCPGPENKRAAMLQEIGQMVCKAFG
jgi:beta-lactamase class A